MLVFAVIPAVCLLEAQCRGLLWRDRAGSLPSDFLAISERPG
jgi:hypothetical protein